MRWILIVVVIAAVAGAFTFRYSRDWRFRHQVRQKMANVQGWFGRLASPIEPDTSAVEARDEERLRLYGAAMSQMNQPALEVNRRVTEMGQGGSEDDEEGTP